MSLYPFPATFFEQPAPAGPSAPASSVLWLSARAAGALWQNTGRTVPAAADYDPVASWYDSTSGRAATQATLTRQPARVGDAVEFDGGDDYLVTLDAAPLRLAVGFAVEAWVWPTANINYPFVAAKDDFASNREWVLLFDTTSGFRPQMIVWNTGGTMVAATDPTSRAINQWYHLVATVSATTITLYVNGASVATAPWTGTLRATTMPVYIGTTAGGLFPLTGSIDELIVYQYGGSLPADSHWAARHTDGLALRG